MTAPEKTPTPAELWERAGYLRAAAVDAYDAYIAAYASASPAYAADAVAVDSYEAGVARWAREHPPQIEAEP